MGWFDGFTRLALNTGFNLYDKNDDGLLTKEELGNGAMSTSESVDGGITKTIVLNAETFDSFDTDKNGSIDKTELHKGFGVEGGELSTGTIIAIVVGCIAVIGLVIGLAAYFSNRNAKKRKEEEQKFYEMQQKDNNNGNAGINLESAAKTQQIT